MTQDNEAADRRRIRAEKITSRTKDYLVDMIVEYHKVAGKKRVSKDNDEVIVGLVDKYEKRITSFIREMLTSDDRGHN